MDILEAKKEVALDVLRRFDRIVVAVSGGVDSALLLALACEAVGPSRLLAATGESSSLAPGELGDARAVAAHLGVAHQTVCTKEMMRREYRANAGDRCYHCRDELFGRLSRLARKGGYDAVAYGAIRDDLGDDRPGMRAASQWAVIAPLLDAGLTKHEVRQLADRAGLPVKDKPAAACLASRLPVGTEVTEIRLRQVAVAETALRHLGFVQLRVRHHGEVARVELDSQGMLRIADAAERERVVRAVREAGFRFVAVDLEGYRSGSLNAAYRTQPVRDGGQ